MKPAACARSWEAEAVEDGRLSSSDAASFERHVASCSICAAEVRAIEQLRAAASRAFVLTSSPLEHRRQRQLLLRRAHELELEPPRAARRWLVASLAVIAVAVALFVAVASRKVEPAPAAIGTPRFELEASREARYRTLERSATLRLALELGRFELQVYKLVAGQRFLLTLPDGELEVQGTRFVVEIEGGRTRRVHVSEGRVALRLIGRPALTLGAAEEFSSEPEVTRPVASSAPPPVNDQPRSAGSETRRASAPPASAVPSAAATPGSDFGVAMKAFGDGDYGRAEQAFLEFERKHPSDSRVEDATFLRAVARSRRGDKEGARRIAESYLERYPNGLRRLEAERIAR